ncbi:hypothetical protein [Prosthecobacter sp.]|uniref:hypothetical protein n=1 Tax=Prosthecobacter sp. TaxID=1965333 RepID=UPI0037838523
MPKHALADLPQELPDELFSQISSALATGDDVGQVVGDFFKNSPELMGAIMLMGGTGGAMGTHQQVNDSIQEARLELSADGTSKDGARRTPDSGSQIPENTSSEPRKNGEASASAPDVVQDKQLAPEVPTPKAAADLDEAGRVIDDIKR